MSDEGTTVVVVDAAGGDAGEPAAAPPAYVTPGELDARLELLGAQLGERIDAAISTAWEARDAAESAADAAAVAQVTAAVAVEVADEAVTASESAAGDDTDTDGDESDGAPKPPVRRSERERPAGEPTPASRPSKSYGAGWLSGRG